MFNPNIPIAAARVAAPPLNSSSSASGQAKCPPGRNDNALSPAERHRLAEILLWAEQHKSEASFKSLYVNDRQDGSYGTWTWRRPCGSIVLTALIRGSMVEFVRENDNTAEFGFLWNNILKEWNDVALPADAGRGFFRAMLGVSVSKTAQERRKQERRIVFRKWWRFMKRFLSRKPRNI